MRRSWIASVVLAFSASASAFAASPWDKACRSFSYTPLKSPTTGLAPGWVIRTRDQEPLRTGCYSGTSQVGEGFSDFSQSATASTHAELRAHLGKYADALASFDRVQSVQYSIQGLTEQRFVDIQPNLTNIDCAVKNLGATTNIKSLLYVKGITLKFGVKQGVDVSAVINEIKTAIGGIDGKAAVSVGTDNSVTISGTSLAIGYRAFTDQWKFNESTVSVAPNGTEKLANLIPGADYRFTYVSGNPAVNLRVASNRPGLVAKSDFRLEPGVRLPIAESKQYGAYVTVTEMSDKKLKLSVEEWTVAMGAQ